MTVKVVIVDDHAIVRQGIEMYLAVDSDIEIIGQGSNGLEALELVREKQPDVVLMDLLMPEMDGVTAIEAIKKEFPQVEIVALTSVLEDKAIIDAVRVGAIGYLLKDTEADKLCNAIKLAAEGQVQFSPKVAARLVRELSAPENPDPLTDREVEILIEVANGLSNKEIAEKLFISTSTAKFHVSSIMAKLNLPSRTRVALYAIKTGLIDLDDIDFSS